MRAMLPDPPCYTYGAAPRCALLTRAPWGLFRRLDGQEMWWILSQRAAANIATSTHDRSTPHDPNRGENDQDPE
jgi:hypothetical protein